MKSFTLWLKKVTIIKLQRLKLVRPVDGNELLTSETALFARMIALHFEGNKFSGESTHAYKHLNAERQMLISMQLITNTE